jgi:hypothetical protein
VVTWLRLFKYLRFVPFMRLLIGTIAGAAGQVPKVFMKLFCKSQLPHKSVSQVRFPLRSAVDLTFSTGVPRP